MSTNGTLEDGKIVGPITLDADPNNPHTLTIAWLSGGAVWLDAVTEYNGDENAGIQVGNCGAPGSTTTDWAAMEYTGIADQGSSMYLIELGANDWSAGTSTATMTANLETIMGKLITANEALALPAPQFTLMPVYTISDGGPDIIGPWSDYVDAQYALAAARTDTTVLDLSIRMPVAVPGGGPYGEYATDGEHPSNIGHSVIADIIAAFLGPQ